MSDMDIDLLYMLDDIYKDNYDSTRDMFAACLAVIEYVVLGKSEQLVCDHNWKQWEDAHCNVRWRCTKCKEVR